MFLLVVLYFVAVYESPLQAENSAPKRYANTQQMADKLQSSGLGCASFESASANERGSSVLHQAKCDLHGQTVILSVFADLDSVKHELAMAREVNKFLKGEVDVAGPNWIVEVGDKVLAGHIAEALDGTVIDFDEIGSGPVPNFSS
jgi:hypothetical protein